MFGWLLHTNVKSCARFCYGYTVSVKAKGKAYRRDDAHGATCHMCSQHSNSHQPHNHADTMQTLLRCTPSRQSSPVALALLHSWLACVVRAGCFFWPRLHIRAFPSYFPRRAPCSHGTTSCPSRLFDRLHLLAWANQLRRVDTRSGGLRGCRPPYRGRRTRHGR